MKITLKLFAVALCALGMSSCYDSFTSDFDYTSTYFAQQKPYVKLLETDSETLDLDAGVALGGVYGNSKTWTVDYTIDESLLTTHTEVTGLTLLPSSYYTVSDDSQMVVNTGEIVGRVTFYIDKAKFMNDPIGLEGTYALPLRITRSDADSVLDGMDYTIIRLTYLNQEHGYYWITGDDTETTTAGSVSTTSYREDDDEFVLNRRLQLTTLSENSWSVPYVGEYTSTGYTMKFTMGSDGSTVTVSAMDDSNITQISGSGTYNKSKTTFTMNYSYTDLDGNSHSVMDELLFSNVSNSDQRVEEWE